MLNSKCKEIMMKKFVLAILLAVVSLGANAQFAKGTKYISTSLSAFDISYRKNNFQLGLDATAGYFTADAWMVYGRFGFGYENQKGPDNDINKFNLRIHFAPEKMSFCDAEKCAPRRCGKLHRTW